MFSYVPNSHQRNQLHGNTFFSTDNNCMVEKKHQHALKKRQHTFYCITTLFFPTIVLFTPQFTPIERKEISTTQKGS